MRLICISIFSLFLAVGASAQCTTFAGTPENSFWEVCQGEVVTFIPPSDMVNDGDDVFFYTIHLGSEWDEIVASVSLTNTFSFSAGLTPGTPYIVTLVMATQQNGGQWIIDENDPCLSFAQMGTLLVHETPELECIAQGVVCGQPEMQVACDTINPNYTYSWSGPNGFTSTEAEPPLPNDGTYCVTVTTPIGCSSNNCFKFILDTTIPGSTITPPDQELCLDTFFVNGFSVPPNSFQQEWTTSGGNILETFGNFIRATGEGEYCVIHTNLANNCADTLCTDVVILGDPPIADAGPSQFLSCNQDTVQLGSPNTSTGPQFTYEWTCNGCSASNPIALIPDPKVSETGGFTLKVTDTTTGCVAYSTTYIEDELFFDFGYEYGVCAGDSAEITVVIFSDNPPYNVYIGENGDTLFEFNNLQSTNIFKIPVEQETIFEIWATDALGCTSPTIYPMPITIDTVDINFTVETNGCNPVSITASHTSNVPNPTVLMNWSTGEIGPTILVTNSGAYSVTVLDGYGCEFTDSIYVTVDYSGLCAYIEGTVVWDNIENCMLDTGEPLLEGWLVEATDGTNTFYGTTDVNGYYFIPVDPGDYSVTLLPPNQQWDVCVNDISVSLPNADDTAVVDFLAFKLPTCPLLTVDISTPFLRRCFGGNIYNIIYCNEGTAPATDAYVVIDFDDFLTLDFSTLPFIDLGNNVYQFEIGDLEIGECASFWTSMTVSCNAVIGQTHCTEAHIYPDTMCLSPDPMWSGASLKVEAVCDDSVRFTVTNIGENPMVNPLEYVVIEDIVMYLQAPPPSITLDVMESHELVVPANGSTWRMEVMQEPFHPEPSYPVIAVEGCGVNANGGFSTGIVNLFPLGDPEPYLDIDCTENIGGCDPNGKYAYPTGVKDEHFIEQNKDIEYIIRFQNTGTDTAFNVLIRDTLSPFLDVASVRPGASSHPYDFEIYGQGILRFTFPNIQLPDSTENEPASNGYVTFRVSQNHDVPLGSVIENSAGIYFDFNEPVITNTVFHTIGEDFLDEVNAINAIDLENGQLRVYPNPIAGEAIFELPAQKLLNPTFVLQDGLGRVLQSEQFTGNVYRFEREHLLPGIYFYSIESNDRSVYTGKIVLE